MANQKRTRKVQNKREIEYKCAEMLAKNKNIAKSGIYTCICHFFFVILQPDFLCVRVYAFE